MKQLFIISSLFIVAFIYSPLEALEDKIVPGEPPTKLIKSHGNVRLKRYGVRIVSENNNRKMKGLYKINIGDTKEFEEIKRMNRRFGFNGSVYIKIKEKKDQWKKIRVYRQTIDTRERKEITVIAKQNLPVPFNSMPDELLNKIQLFNIYPENDYVIVVYPEGETGLSECEVIFNHIEQELQWLKNAISL